MVAINFQSQFVEALLLGTKRQTIRRKARCKPGDKIQIYTGQCTKDCRLLGEAICIITAPVVLYPSRAYIGSHMLSDSQRQELAMADGFSNYAEMHEWFKEKYKSRSFEGVIIKW